MHAEDATPAVGGLIDELYAKREKIRKLTKEVDALKAERDELELRLLETMDAQGVSMSRSDLATASVSEVIRPVVENWDEFYTWIHRNKAYYMLERRPAAAAYRELMESRRKPIPGVSQFVQRSILLRTR
jgi:predicted transcriptional regulator